MKEKNLNNELLYFDMPEYDNINEPEPAVTVTIKCKTVEDFQELKQLLKDKIYNGAKVFDGMQRETKKSTWYPLKEKASKYYYE
jgi:hypothetical protein